MKCEDCKERKGILDFSPDGMTGYTHGFVIKICRQCLIERLEKIIKGCKEQIKEQKALIRKDKFRSEKNE